MTEKSRVLVINGSYRDDGITDRAVAIAVDALEEQGAEVEVINLRQHPIEFCHNCRECTLQPGDAPGICVIDDGMNALIGKIEAAQAYILAAPTNFSSVTALYKRFMERLIPYGYWPWGQPAPKFRKSGLAQKKALLISSSAAPGIFGRLMYDSSKQLRMTARIIGAKPVGTLFTGLISKEKYQRLPRRTADRARQLASRLIAA
ncbi:MAG: flavodoxin family protein [Gammaproteobacteria bacterium]|nr:flavodoxin family protein [Gammaproteobacteria bacterium]MDH3448559.1 flavodoxin family protein [Gammaproteobacteria bacterium]